MWFYFISEYMIYIDLGSVFIFSIFFGQASSEVAGILTAPHGGIEDSYPYILFVGDASKASWWFHTCLIFHNIVGRIIPTEFHIFQRGKSTINQKSFCQEHPVEGEFPSGIKSIISQWHHG